MRTFCVIVSLSLILSCVTARLQLPNLVCSLNHQQKRVFIDCVRPFFTDEFKAKLRNFLDCANLRHFIDYLRVTCENDRSDPQRRQVVRCLNRYPAIRNLPGSDLEIQRCANRAAYY